MSNDVQISRALGTIQASLEPKIGLEITENTILVLALDNAFQTSPEDFVDVISQVSDLVKRKV